jgi:lipopolysaccharide transport protein LptA
MASSISKRAGHAATLLAFACVSVAAAAPTGVGKGAISLDAASTEVDYKNNTIVFRDVTISQGELKVEAERAEASGLDFVNSRWSFAGNVRINLEQRGNLQSDRAVVDFKDNTISRAVITGTPAVFQQRNSITDKLARGRASAIAYEVVAGTVRLSDNAWLTDGRNEISGPVLIYNIREERVQAASQAGASDRVRITILPQSGKPEKPK